MNTRVYVSFWNLLYDAGNPKLVLCDNLEGCNGEGGSRGRDHMHTYGKFKSMFGRNHHNIVKYLSSNKNKNYKKLIHLKGKNSGKSYFSLRKGL